METFYSDNNVKKIKENKGCIDAMLWIGNKPRKYQTVDEFVKEAQFLKGKHMRCNNNRGHR